MRRLPLALMALLALACGDSREHTTILPTVQVPAAPAEFITCHDARGKGPDRQVPLHHADAPGFCFVGGECFYACR